MVSLHSPKGRHLPAIRAVQRGLSMAFAKWLKFAPITAAPNASQHKAILTYIYTNQSQKGDASQLEAMCHTSLTVLMPPGWGCVAVS